MHRSDCSPFVAVASRVLICALLISARCVAADSDEEKIPPLFPPRGPLPPGWWEQYGIWVILAAAALLLLIAATVWLLLRPKPPVVIPPETQARQTLEALRTEPETGAVLSRVSQVVRGYFRIAFHLAEGELTTSELCRALETAPEPAPELKAEVARLLRECDERKFAPAPVQNAAHAPQKGAPRNAPLGAVSRALKLIEQAEAGRRQLPAQNTAAEHNNSPQTVETRPATPEGIPHFGRALSPKAPTVGDLGEATPPKTEGLPPGSSST